ncbi:hypothetical protein P691DRAFT_454038 [Macrolepiota fuliginosa MF-IS2]|uniref:Uncharacterized protein n=1 Tax=Macrolepiota fuliginosa MF-IS2 TaxID=1400762 RepID=A0A9P5XFT2_9AGAR|nr:hypothetical protein P691DRAFT_454038 [Macrolepiota fuliginosa MF-IS2]
MAGLVEFFFLSPGAPGRYLLVRLYSVSSIGFYCVVIFLHPHLLPARAFVVPGACCRLFHLKDVLTRCVTGSHHTSSLSSCPVACLRHAQVVNTLIPTLVLAMGMEWKKFLDTYSEGNTFFGGNRNPDLGGPKRTMRFGRPPYIIIQTHALTHYRHTHQHCHLWYLTSLHRQPHNSHHSPTPASCTFFSPCSCMFHLFWHYARTRTFSQRFIQKVN